MKINKGDVVRSYDFPEMKHSYVEGVVMANDVEAPDCPRYDIICTKRVVNDSDVTEDHMARGAHFYPPINGIETVFGRITNGVERLP